jgi:hypothetical protein
MFEIHFPDPKSLLKPEIMKRSFLIYTILLLFAFQLHAKDVLLHPGFTIYVNDSVSPAIINSLDILQRDLRNTLGQESVIRSDWDQLKGVSNSVIILNQEAGNSASIAPLEGFEQHKLFVHNGNLILQGADIRGTIYAILSFSEQFLGVKPLWFWSGSPFKAIRHIEIPGAYAFDSGEPYVKYRAWFPNDQDMFDPWRQLSGINNEILYETLLRLKMNTIEVEKTIDYSTPGAITDNTRIIDRYGLIITFHHHSPMNSKLRDWHTYWEMMGKEGGPEYKLSFMPELEEFWRYNVKTLIDNGIDDIIWGVNFRGEGDIPFWTTFEDAPENMKERGQVINKAVSKQVQILKEENGGRLPMTRMIFYDEMSDLLAEGYLAPPKEENLIWNFVAARRDHFPNEDIRSLSINEDVRLGYYMNLQFTSTGSHLAQAEGPWKMEKNYRYLDSKNKQPMAFSVTNAGNIREHLLTLTANAEMMWNFNTYDSDAFLVNFCKIYFGEEHAESVYELYKKYFHAYWNQKKNDLPDFERQYIFHDLRYKQAVRQLSPLFFDPVDMNPLKDFSWEQLPNRTFRIVPEDHGVGNQVDALIKGTYHSYKKFSKVAQMADSLSPCLPPDTRGFFNDNLRYQAHLMMNLNDAVHNYCRAYISNSKEEQLSLLRESLYAAEKAKLSLYRMAHNQFETWYAHERIFDIDDFVSRIKNTYDTVNN